MNTLSNANQFTVVVPAAGVGKRMASDLPKQYLVINNKTIIEHTVERLLSHPNINRVVLSISPEDEYYSTLSLKNNPQVNTVFGGKERYDSVLAGLQSIDATPWVLVHDAARPCVTHNDITTLIEYCLKHNQGAILATPVRDTMKRTDVTGNILKTEERNNLWHAQTPQMFPTKMLVEALKQGVADNKVITDEASAIELMGKPNSIVSGREDNIKITRPSDLGLAAFILTQQKEEICA